MKRLFRPARKENPTNIKKESTSDENQKYFLCGKMFRNKKRALKMRSAQTPYGAQAIMKKFIIIRN